MFNYIVLQWSFSAYHQLVTISIGRATSVTDEVLLTIFPKPGYSSLSQVRCFFCCCRLAVTFGVHSSCTTCPLFFQYIGNILLYEIRSHCCRFSLWNAETACRFLRSNISVNVMLVKRRVVQWFVGCLLFAFEQITLYVRLNDLFYEVTRFDFSSWLEHFTAFVLEHQLELWLTYLRLLKLLL
jgi:hypothetical protein